ncbi:hypothetical protein B0H10DRAFT_1941143 [Mycena sp. CBHHK59/15]|nr:hypothetical protein B0H10DRAFT_1941143 [Mycena sp. CBHHK59/15]
MQELTLGDYPVKKTRAVQRPQFKNSKIKNPKSPKVHKTWVQMCSTSPSSASAHAPTPAEHYDNLVTSMQRVSLDNKWDSPPLDDDDTVDEIMDVEMVDVDKLFDSPEDSFPIPQPPLRHPAILLERCHGGAPMRVWVGVPRTRPPQAVTRWFDQGWIEVPVAKPAAAPAPPPPHAPPPHSSSPTTAS